MANVKIPYQLIAAVPTDRRREHMQSAIARGLPRIERHPVDDAQTLYVACFGPSLRETWKDLVGKRPLISMSGATKFLAERGVIADYALEMDPRESQLVVSLPPVPGVHYLIASVVCPAYFDRVLEAGNKVTLWHTVSTNFEDEVKWVGQHDPEEGIVVHGGSTVGLTALHVGGLLGFNRFEIHGMDGSFAPDGTRHAALHGGKSQPDDITWAAGGRPYRTSKIMANAVAETINTAKNFPIVTIWHGDGLTQALIREAKLLNAACVDEREKVAKLTIARPVVIKTPPIKKAGRPFWDALLDFLTPVDLQDLVNNIAICEPRRKLAKFNTGSIPFESAAYLRALSRFYEPEVVVEIGTFIGTSTLALNPKRVIYTCDRSNDCVPSVYDNDRTVVTHPFQSSTEMLAEIQEPVDLFFFDGRIQHEDLPHIQRLMKPSSVFVFDDHIGTEKGVANLHAIAPLIMPTHALITQAAGAVSTLAVAVPFREQAA